MKLVVIMMLVNYTLSLSNLRLPTGLMFVHRYCHNHALISSDGNTNNIAS